MIGSESAACLRGCVQIDRTELEEGEVSMAEYFDETELRGILDNAKGFLDLSKPTFSTVCPTHSK